MRICLVARSPFVGGAEIACERLAVGLQAAGHAVVVLTGFENEVAARYRSAGLDCRVYETPLRDKWHLPRYLLARHRLRRFFQKWRPDIIHSNDLPTHQVVSSAARSLGVPRLCHHRFVYDGAAIDWLNRSGAECHVFVSKYLQEELRSQSARLAAEPSCVLYDGLPLPELPTAEERVAARVKLGLPLDKTIVLYAGQLVERKGVSDLLEAWAMLPKPVAMAAELVVAGDDIQNQGAYRVAMEQLAARLGIKPRFVGFRKDVPEWLKAAHIATVPSRVEPLGNATLEAMAYGLPVIGGDTGGIPEMVVDRATGWLVPPADPQRLGSALLKALSDPAACQTVGVAARGRCEKVFSLECHVQAALRVYERMQIPPLTATPADVGPTGGFNSH